MRGYERRQIEIRACKVDNICPYSALIIDENTQQQGRVPTENVQLTGLGRSELTASLPLPL